MRLIQKAFHLRTGLATAVLLLLLLMLALSGVISSAQNTTKSGIKNFGKVNDNYYRGSQPTRAQMADLKAMGVKTVIDLRRDYVPAERLWAREQGLTYVNIPLKSHQRATQEQTEYFLRLVNDQGNGPFYVHCRGGKHRTGALTAVYRITHDGWTAQQAFEEMKKYDFNDTIFGGPPDQKNFVFDFYAKWKK